MELSLLGPGYGESVLLHTSEGEWLVVDSCLGADGEPAAMNDLRGMEVDPSSGCQDCTPNPPGVEAIHNGERYRA